MFFQATAISWIQFIGVGGQEKVGWAVGAGGMGGGSGWGAEVWFFHTFD